MVMGLYFFQLHFFYIYNINGGVENEEKQNCRRYLAWPWLFGSMVEPERQHIIYYNL